MIGSVVLAVAVSASPVVTKIAAPGLHFVNVETKLGEFYSEHLAQQLKYAGLQVITSREMQSLLGLERQKQLLGCSEGACMTELANALGADGILLGDVALLGSTYQVNLKIIGSGDGKTLALESTKASSEAALLEVLTNAAQKLARDASVSLGRPPPVAIGSSSGGVRKFAWAPAALGVAAIGAGVACLVVTENAHKTLTMDTNIPNGAELVATGKTTGPLAVAGFAVGGAALAGAAAMFFLGADSPVTVTTAITPNGAAIGVAGVFP